MVNLQVLKLTSTTKNVLLFVLFLFALLSSSASEPVPLILNFEGIQNNNGHIIISVYKTEADFKAEKPYMLKTFSKQNVKNGRLKASLNLPEGTYGIAVLDDENKDREMNYTMLGMPKEGFGFANYFHRGFTYPKFSDFSFQHQKASKHAATVKLRYM